MRRLAPIAALLGLACVASPPPPRAMSLTACGDPALDVLAPVARARLYPREAYARGIEGEVVVSYEIGADGRPRDVRVEASEPPGVFDAAAVATVSHWRFCPPEPEVPEDARAETRIRFDMTL